MEKNRKLNVLDLVKDPLHICHREDFHLSENDAISLSLGLEDDYHASLHFARNDNNYFTEQND